MARTLQESIEIALEYAGLATDFVGVAHKLVGAKDGDVGKTIKGFVSELSETEREDFYASIRSQTIKWAKMRNRGDTNNEEEEQPSQQNLPQPDVSNSKSSPTGNSVQSTPSSNMPGAAMQEPLQSKSSVSPSDTKKETSKSIAKGAK